MPPLVDLDRSMTHHLSRCSSFFRCFPFSHRSTALYIPYVYLLSIWVTKIWFVNGQTVCRIFVVDNRANDALNRRSAGILDANVHSSLLVGTQHLNEFLMHVNLLASEKVTSYSRSFPREIIFIFLDLFQVRANVIHRWRGGRRGCVGSRWNITGEPRSVSASDKVPLHFHV